MMEAPFSPQGDFYESVPYPRWLPSWVPWLAGVVETHDRADPGSLADCSGDWRIAFVDISRHEKTPSVVGKKRSYATGYVLDRIIYILDSSELFRSDKVLAVMQEDESIMNNLSQVSQGTTYRLIFPPAIGTVFNEDSFGCFYLESEHVHLAPKFSRTAFVRSAARIGLNDGCKAIEIPFHDVETKQNGIIYYSPGDGVYAWWFSFSSEKGGFDKGQKLADAPRAERPLGSQGELRHQIYLSNNLYTTEMGPAWAGLLPRTKKELRIYSSKTKKVEEPKEVPSGVSLFALIGSHFIPKSAHSPGQETNDSFFSEKTDLDEEWDIHCYAAVKIDGKVSFSPCFKRANGGHDNEYVVISPWGMHDKADWKTSGVPPRPGHAMVLAPDVNIYNFNVNASFEGAKKLSLPIVETCSRAADCVSLLQDVPEHWVLGPPRLMQNAKTILTTPTPLVRDAKDEEVNAALCTVEGGHATEWLLVMSRPHHGALSHSFLETREYFASITDRYQNMDSVVPELRRIYSEELHLDTRKQHCACPLRLKLSDFHWTENQNSEGQWENLTLSDVQGFMSKTSHEVWDNLGKDVSLTTLNHALRSVMMTEDGGTIWDANEASGTFYHEGCYHSLQHQKDTRSLGDFKRLHETRTHNRLAPCSLCGVRGAVLSCLGTPCNDKDCRGVDCPDCQPCPHTMHLFCAVLSEALQLRPWKVSAVVEDDVSDGAIISPNTYTVSCPEHTSASDRTAHQPARSSDSHMLHTRLLCIDRETYNKNTAHLETWRPCDLRLTESEVSKLVFKVEAFRPKGGITRKSGEIVNIKCDILYGMWAADSGGTFCGQIDAQHESFANRHLPAFKYSHHLDSSEYDVISGNENAFDTISETTAVGPKFALNLGRLVRGVQIKTYCTRAAWGESFINLTVLRDFRPMRTPHHFLKHNKPNELIVDEAELASRDRRTHDDRYFFDFCKEHCEDLAPPSADNEVTTLDTYDGIKLFKALDDAERRLNLTYRYMYWKLVCYMKGLPFRDGYFLQKRTQEDAVGSVVCLYGLGELRHLLWEMSTLPAFSGYYTYVIDGTRVADTASLASRILLDVFEVAEGTEKRLASLLGLLDTDGQMLKSNMCSSLSGNVLVALLRRVYSAEQSAQLQPSDWKSGAPLYHPEDSAPQNAENFAATKYSTERAEPLPPPSLGSWIDAMKVRQDEEMDEEKDHHRFECTDGTALLKAQQQQRGGKEGVKSVRTLAPFRRVSPPNPTPRHRMAGKDGKAAALDAILRNSNAANPLRIALFIHDFDSAAPALWGLVQAISAAAPEMLRVCCTVRDLPKTRRCLKGTSGLSLTKYREVEMSTFIYSTAPVAVKKKGVKRKKTDQGRSTSNAENVKQDSRQLESFEPVLRSIISRDIKGCLWLLAMLQVQSGTGPLRVVSKELFYKKSHELQIHNDPLRGLHTFIDHGLVLKSEQEEGYHTILKTPEGLHKLAQPLAVDIGKWFGSVLNSSRLQ